MNPSHRSAAVSLLVICLSTASAPKPVSAQSPAGASVAEATGDMVCSQEALPAIPVDRIDALIDQAIADGQMPGAVVAVADQKRLLFSKAYGHRQLQPKPIPMECDTVFDLASLTKPVATACSVMALAASGQVDLEAPAARYLPEFAVGGKNEITITDLLVHQGGLIADNSLSDYADGADRAWRRICELQPVAPPGEKFVYSDVGFIVLGKLVERISGRPLDEFSRAKLFEPLGMHETTFNPPEPLRQRAAATEKRDGQWIVGQVHDPRAHRLGGVAGHAGLFSTASDLIRFGQALLERAAAKPAANAAAEDAATEDAATEDAATEDAATENGRPVVLSAQIVQEMIEPHRVSRGLRGLGWDIRSPYSSNRGETFSESAFGHGGFTGTVLWVDPEKDLVFVFLSNRLHPDGEGSVNRLAGQIATLVAQ